MSFPCDQKSPPSSCKPLTNRFPGLFSLFLTRCGVSRANLRIHNLSPLSPLERSSQSRLAATITHSSSHHAIILIESLGLQASTSTCSAKSSLVHSQKAHVERKGIFVYGPYIYSIITTTSNHSPGGQHERHIIRLRSRLTNVSWISDQSHSHGWALHIYSYTSFIQIALTAIDSLCYRISTLTDTPSATDLHASAK